MVWSLAALVCIVLPLATTAPSAQTVASPAVPLAQDQPVRFEVNRGQADPRVRYLSRARDYTVALTADEALLLVRKPAASSRTRQQGSDLALVRMRLLGASPTPHITAADPLPARVYFAGSGARGALTPIDTFARVEYAGVYPGIDLVYYGDDQQLEFDFVVAPFADPDRIALSLDGADGLSLTATGDLAMQVGGAAVRLEKPLVYQERDGHRAEIPGAYVLPTDGTRTVRFRLGDYDRSRPLVIDPAWMTVFGSTNEDWLSGFAVDSAGQARALGVTFDPATFPFTHLETGVLPAPICFLTKLDGATGLNAYTILFENTQRCDTLALSPSDVAYFTGFVYPNGFHNNQGTTVTVVDDSTGVPVISRFGVPNHDSSAIGDGVDALAVNSLGHVFLLGPCRRVGPGDPPLELSGYNETPDAADSTLGEGCAPPGPGLSERTQPLLTVVDSSGAFLYGSFLSPGELVSEYGLAADDTDRAYIVGAASPAVAPTPDAYRAVCPTVARAAPLCAYLMVLDTTTTGQSSLSYASYLWNTENASTVAVRLGPAGEVYIASEGRVFDDFPSNRPVNPATWGYSLFPGLMEGIQVARFDPDPNAVPSHFEFALIFDPSAGVAALAGHTVRDELADLRLFPSGAPAIATIAHTPGLAPLGVVTTFDPAVHRVGEVWTQNLGTRAPPAFAVAAGPGGSLFLAGQVDSQGGHHTDVFVEHIDSIDPGANQPPTVRILEALVTHGGPITIYADSPTAGALLQLNALADDPDGDPLTYAWSGPFTDSPVTTNHFISARVALGMQQTVTVTVDDGHGHVASASLVFHVVGTPFVGTTATPVDSAINGLAFNYAPLTITATAIGGGGGSAYLRTRLDQNPPIPAHLQAGSPPIYFEVTTDATLVGPLSICIDTLGMSLADRSGIRLYHYQQAGPLGTWADITSPGYPQGAQLCGQNNSLGTFAIFYPQVASTAVQTIAGNGVLEGSHDGPGGNPVDDYRDGPATATALNYLYGAAFDRAANHLFVSAGAYILRLNLNDHTIARVAGNGVGALGAIDGPGGDTRDDLVEGGNAFDTFVGNPAELTLSPAGDVVFFDRSTCRVRRLDVAQGRLFAVAGNGICGSDGDGLPAELASVSNGPMAFDAAGHLFLADGSTARVRRIDALTNLIDTVAGDGTFGTPANGSPARSTISLPLGLAFDAQGHLLIAGGLHLLRVSTGAGDALVDGDADEVITVVGGCNTNCLAPFNGDGLAISHPQVYLSGMGHITVAQDGSVLLSDSFRIRRIVPGADGIVTGAADEIITTVAGYYDWETSSLIHNYNGDTFATQSRFSHTPFPVDDLQGAIIVVDSNNHRVRRFGLPPQPVDPNSADLAIAATDSPDPVTTSDSLQYDVAITNHGPATATGVTITYVIPAGAVFASATSAGPGACVAPAAGSTGTVICDVGSLAAGASSTVEITVTPQTSGTLSSTFAVAGLQADPEQGNNAATVSTTVTLAPVVITVAEVVRVVDSVAVLPSAMIGITEQIVVADGVGLLPSAMIGISEVIRVTDALQVSVDATPPVLALPAPIETEAQSPGGAVVTFSVSATDNAPGAVHVACSPASGSLFPFNGSSPTTTTVTCTATDASGNTATGSFDVVVQDTTAPQVITAQITIDATETAGARGNVPQAPHSTLLQQIPLLAAAMDAGDQNPARVSVQWVACGNHAQVLGAIADATLYPIGQNCFSYVFRDASGNTGTGIGTIEVSAPIGGPINLPNVPVTATDLNNVPLPVTATFLVLDQPGLLTAVPPPFIPPPPAGFILVGPAFEIRSTALAPDAAVVCLRPPFGEFAEHLFLFEHGQWVERTATGNPVTGEVCSHPGPVGTFALARPDLPPLSLTLTPQSASADILNGHVVEARVVDHSNPHSRVTFTAGTPLTVEFRDPLAPDAPLSVAALYDHTSTVTGLTVSLATNALGQVISTARQVADAIHAAPGLANVISNTWPGTDGAGIVVPTPQRQLTRLVFSHPSLSGMAPLYVSAPGRIAIHVLSAGAALHSTASIVAHLDADDDGAIHPDELVASAEVTWVDLTPPMVSLPASITVPATSAAGAVVTYAATAFDLISGPVTPSCTMPSGTTFPVGTTFVTCTATDASGNEGIGFLVVTVLPFVPGPPVLTTLTPATASAGGAGLAITITGNGFASGATAFWNGAARPTVVNSTTELIVSVSAADLATTAYLTTAQITVGDASAGVSNPLPFVIVSATVATVDARIALPGESATASNAPNQPAQHGVTATLNNDDGASPPATVTVASYATNPVGDSLFAAGGFFDIQVTGADPSDSLIAHFYYPNTVTGAAENRLELLYWNGTAWDPVVGSGGAAPLKDVTDDLDGTISGGRFTVMLDSTSIPAVTDLGGTVFALVEEQDRVAPVTTAERSPAPNAHGWNNTDVAVTLTATDNLSGVARTEFTVNGGSWQTYDGPIVLRHSGSYALKYRSVDADGNVEPVGTTTVKIDKTDPVAIVVALPPLLLPANRRMVDIAVLPVALDLFSGVDTLTLVSVTSNDPGMTADDATGWTIGTNDTRGKLRAERTASGGRRIYMLTYRVTDRAGNQALATAYAIVPGVRD